PRQAERHHQNDAGITADVAMCANYFVILAQQHLAAEYGVEAATHLDARELFPKQMAPTIVRDPSNRRTLRMMRWGLLPAWAKSERDQPQPFNAQAEGIAVKPFFRDAFHRRRCL